MVYQFHRPVNQVHLVNSWVCRTQGVQWRIQDFPGSVDPLGRMWTSDTGAFYQKCMQKGKNWVPWGGGAALGTPPRSASGV